jgi:hypothetical protein
MVYSAIKELRGVKMSITTLKPIFFVLFVVGFLISCAQLKEAGRTIGHTTRDVTTAIGHGARDVTKEIGHGTRDVVRDVGDGARDATNSASEEVKKVVKPSGSSSEY